MPWTPKAQFTNILRQSYDYLTTMPKLRSTYNERLFYKTSYEELTAFLGTVAACVATFSYLLTFQSTAGRT